MIKIMILDGVNAAGTVTTVPCEVGEYNAYSFHIWFSSSSLVGSLKIQASNNSTDWVDIKGGTDAIASGESHIWNVVAASYHWTRFIWTPTSGTGTISALFVVKQPKQAI